MGHERRGSVRGRQRDNLARSLLEHSRRNMRAMTLRATWRAFSPAIVVLTAVRTLRTVVGQRIPGIDCHVGESGELKQQYSGKDTQGPVPKRPEAGLPADASLGAER